MIPTNLLRWLPVLLLLLLQGCSLLKTAYNNAPTASYFWLDSYLDFTSVQKPAVQAELLALHDWHRKHELPLYASFLAGLQANASNDVQPDAVCKAFDEVRERVDAFSQQLLPVLTKATVNLDDKQLAHLEKQFAKKNKQWREEWLEDTPQALKEHRVEKAIDRAEDIYGRMQQAQIDVIKSSIEASSMQPQILYREIQRRQADTLQTLKILQAPATEDQIKAALTGLIQRYLESPDAAYVKHFEIIRNESCHTTAKLHNATTPEQRSKAIKTLQGYETMFRQLQAP